MKTLMELAGNRAHQRTIRISTYQVDDSHVLGEGELIDDRLNDYYLLSGERREAGVIHHMRVLLLVNTKSMAIEDCELEMKSVPREICREAAESLQRIKGLVIARGFTMKVRSLMGGALGCTHVMTLVIEMAPALIQGYWTAKSRKPVNLADPDEKKTLRLFRDTLVNTCHVWRENGPTLEKLKRELESID
ncbi:MAG: DUF2889 domain-containing protein [Spirochaetes bacterium]|nr:DUF2889 domain-containing protein [Spirochaetota bacterium]